MVGCDPIKDEGCCSCNSKKVLVEYLYLDLKTCDRCIGTDAVLEEVLKEIGPALLCAGSFMFYVELKERSKCVTMLNSHTNRTIEKNYRKITKF